MSASRVTKPELGAWRGSNALQRHRALLDDAVEKYLTNRDSVLRRMVRAHAQHVAAVENPYLVNDVANLKRIEAMAVWRVRNGRSQFCPKRCTGGLVMAHGMCTNGHDLGRY